MRCARRIEVKGLVQGVGFRPFVHRLAKEYSILGWVDNRPDCVCIHAEGDSSDIHAFEKDINERKPRAATIFSIESHETAIEGSLSFEIVKSRVTADNNEITEVSPDIAVCDDCRADMKLQAHRINYPFINCTNCGPRFTIIRDLPYDRQQTTMSVFPMCEICLQEYTDIDDRRYHAQPVACNHCGPEYSLLTPQLVTRDLTTILEQVNWILNSHGVVAIKGLGGYNIMCSALDEQAVQRIRHFKNRESKPFAVMFASPEQVKRFCLTSSTEMDTLNNWQRPIVIVDANTGLAPSVSNGFPTVGAMLPYMPLHHLLFEEIQIPALVMTSGNISEEPIMISDDDSIRILGSHVDAILSHDREIYNRCDDSVIRVINGEVSLLRRSRGFTPSPLRVSRKVDGIFAAGAELANCFAIGKGSQAILSQHIGDLKNYETFEFYRETYERFCRLFRFDAKLVACDLHPDYFSTRFAESLGLELIKVQHHHAHIVSCLAENQAGGPVIGVSFDGTGLGSDGNIWGSEFLICDHTSFERKSHFEYVRLPGGDKVVDEPWRTSLSCLIHTFGSSGLDIFRQIPAFGGLNPDKADLVAAAVNQGINAPYGCSAGRLFDAVAAITGVCLEPGFHAEAPMRLEAVASQIPQKPYPFDAGETISFTPMFRELIDDINGGMPVSIISRRFHDTMTKVIIDTVDLIASESGVKTVALSGGVFQNRLLSESLNPELKARGYRIFSHSKIPAGDAGIAIGQMMVAAATLTNQNH